MKQGETKKLLIRRNIDTESQRSFINIKIDSDSYLNQYDLKNPNYTSNQQSAYPLLNKYQSASQTRNQTSVSVSQLSHIKKIGNSSIKTSSQSPQKDYLDSDLAQSYNHSKNTLNQSLDEREKQNQNQYTSMRKSKQQYASINRQISTAYQTKDQQISQNIMRNSMRASSSSGINKIRIIRKQQQHLQNSNENESYQSEHNQSFLKQSKTGGRRNIKITNDLSESQSSMVKIKEPSFIRSGGETIEKYYGLKNHSTRNQDTGQFQSKKLRNDQLPRKDQLISSTDQKSSQLSRLRYAKQFPLEYDPSPKQKQFTRNNLLGNFSQKIIDRQSLKTSHQRYAVKDPYGLQSEVDFQSKNNQSLIDDRNYNSSTEIDPNQTSIYFQTYNNKMYKQKESLSSFTRESNSEIRSTLSKLHEIDQKYSKHQDNLNQDCQTLLTQANRDIKSLNYKLLRIISTNNDSHINIFPMRQNHIEIIEATHIYCKINVKGYQLPARFSVMFKQDQTSLRKQQTNVSLKSQKSLKRQMPELKIWLSTHHKEPNEEHFDKYLFNVSYRLILFLFKIQSPQMLCNQVKELYQFKTFGLLNQYIQKLFTIRKSIVMRINYSLSINFTTNQNYFSQTYNFLFYYFTICSRLNQLTILNLLYKFQQLFTE